MKRILPVTAVLLLSGCAAKPPSAWLLYAHANYLYGRVEALTEVACQKPTEVTKAACAEAARVQGEIKNLNPVVQAELAKSEPDWNLILKYADLIIGAAAKVLIP